MIAYSTARSADTMGRAGPSLHRPSAAALAARRADRDVTAGDQRKQHIDVATPAVPEHGAQDVSADPRPQLADQICLMRQQWGRRLRWRSWDDRRIVGNGVQE